MRRRVGCAAVVATKVAARQTVAAPRSYSEHGSRSDTSPSRDLNRRPLGRPWLRHGIDVNLLRRCGGGSAAPRWSRLKSRLGRPWLRHGATPSMGREATPRRVAILIVGRWADRGYATGSMVDSSARTVSLATSYSAASSPAQPAIASAGW